ncbi:hypothetical protein SG34_015140 [Thalassomonas viridans]|uniref:Uncharacterized protein n=1 Tax=Thalassomonas viridans TaxID=137584 RepID=A0AAE9YYN8_9GAMM|nr:hypothetical protein [Thalassomonas viridans]WDE02779.1 hypothetical protein SG34_015140 [Thalassomonas viridans]
MAKPNDMPEFHSVKVSLTENIPIPIPDPGHLPATYVMNVSRRDSSCEVFTAKGGRYHV